MSEIDTSGLKARVIEAVNEHPKPAQAIIGSLFGEHGSHESEAAKCPTAMREQHEFAVQRRAYPTREHSV